MDNVEYCIYKLLLGLGAKNGDYGRCRLAGPLSGGADVPYIVYSYHESQGFQEAFLLKGLKIVFGIAPFVSFDVISLSRTCRMDPVYWYSQGGS